LTHEVVYKLIGIKSAGSLPTNVLDLRQPDDVTRVTGRLLVPDEVNIGDVGMRQLCAVRLALIEPKVPSVGQLEFVP
jgi:hypothetical protein